MMSIATRITVDEYDRMIAEGAFESEMSRPRLELIDGEILPMSPIGPLHEDLVDALAEWSMTKPPRHTVRVRIQNSVGIPALESAPQPDVAWVKRGRYGSGRPLPDVVLGIIEVADSSLVYDRGRKARMFAATGVKDYWVVNIPGRYVEVFRDPVNGRCRSHQVFKAPQEIRPLAFPRIKFPLAILFPKS
jgi:Uma2 family endonuclease